MRTLVLLFVMASSLVLEWLAIVKTGLLDRIMHAPTHLVTNAMKPLLLSGSATDFVICLSAVLVLCATVSVLAWVLVYIPYLVAKVSSAPFAKD